MSWLNWSALVLSVISFSIAMYNLGRLQGYDKGREDAYSDMLHFLSNLMSIAEEDDSDGGKEEM